MLRVIQDIAVWTASRIAGHGGKVPNNVEIAFYAPFYNPVQVFQIVEVYGPGLAGVVKLALVTYVYPVSYTHLDVYKRQPHGSGS